MDRKIEKAIEDFRLTTKELIQEFISTLNNAQSGEIEYQKLTNKWFKAKTKLENLGLSMAIKDFEFKYIVYQKPNQSTPTKKMELTAQDNKLLKSLKIIPPDEEIK